MSGKLTLILGGARSGKSRYAETLALEQDRPVLYVATCRTTGLDSEMQARITRHQADRPSHWETLENTFDLCEIIRTHPEQLILLDCLTLWLGHQSEALPDEAAIIDALKSAWEALRESDTHMIAVSNELGLGLVPATPEARAFRDLCGRANQLTARCADEVVFMLAGLPWEMKPHR